MDDNDGVPDVDDDLPLNASESVDTDDDGIGNNADTDDDGDSVPDVYDALLDELSPLIPIAMVLETTQTKMMTTTALRMIMTHSHTIQENL